MARVWSRCCVQWMLDSQPGSNCQEFQKVVSFVVLLRKQRTAHQTAERIYTQNPVRDLPVTSCQEPRSVRVYWAEERNVIVAFRCRHDVKVSRSSVRRELFRDGKNVLVLHRIGMAQNVYTPLRNELTDSIQPSSPSSPFFPSFLTTLPLVLAARLSAARLK